MDLLGKAGPRIRRRACQLADRGIGTGGARCHPHGPHVHWRLEWELALRCPASLRLCQPTHVSPSGRRTAASRLLHHGGGPLRAAGKPSNPRRVGCMSTLSRTGVGVARERPISRRPGSHRAPPVAQSLGLVGRARAAGSATIRTRCPDPHGRWTGAVELVSPEPPKHEHRETHPPDVVRGVPHDAKGAGWSDGRTRLESGAEGRG